MPPFPEVNQTPINNMEFICQGTYQSVNVQTDFVFIYLLRIKSILYNAAWTNWFEFLVSITDYIAFSLVDISPGVPTLTKGLIPLSTGDTDFNTLVFPSRNARNPSPFIPAVVISAVGYQVGNNELELESEFWMRM